MVVTHEATKGVAKVVKEEFLTLIPNEMIDAETGKIVGVPQGFDPIKHRSLKMDNFSSKADYLDFLATNHEAVVAKKQGLADKYRKRAKHLREHGSDIDNKSVERVKQTLARTVDKLKRHGVDVDAAIKDLAGEDAPG